jgi:hypothetical protein
MVDVTHAQLRDADDAPGRERAYFSGADSTTTSSARRRRGSSAARASAPATPTPPPATAVDRDTRPPG